MFGGNFAEGVNGSVNEISIQEVGIEAFRAFIDYLYTDDVDLESADVVCIFYHILKYEMKKMKNEMIFSSLFFAN